MTPKKGYNDKKYKDNYDSIDWSSVRKNSKGPYFITNLDSFEGNSGAPVFSERDQFVEGILVGGEDDFFWDSKKDCYRVKRCSEKRCQGESVTKITALKELRNLIAEN